MTDKGVLVIGGGISGITAAVELAEAGHKVALVERNPYLGGRVAQLNKYFPKLCPPVCGLELNFRRIRENGDVAVHTMSEVAEVKAADGGFSVTLRKNPRYVNDRCTTCGECIKACPAERPNEFNFGMDKTKAIYLPFNQAFPQRFVIERSRCPQGCSACKDACRYDAVDLDMKPETTTLNVASVIQATGWSPYDASKLDTLGFGKAKNVVTNMMMERLASPSGPTGGRILRPSDGKEARNVAFVQCAGSRDENHLAFCSYICCMASLKQSRYLREQYSDSKAEVFYIDMRTPGRYEKFLDDVKADPGITLTKGKVARAAEVEGGDVEVEVEDVLSGRKIKKRFDMVVLATGMQPSGAAARVPGVTYTEEGFALSGGGVFAAGAGKSPLDVQRSVQSATAAALKGIQSLVRR